MEEKGELVSLYLKVKMGVKEKLEKAARERGYPYLADFAGELLEKALGEPRRKEPEKPETIQRLIGVWRLKTCRFLGEDGYCNAWELSKEDAERIYGDEAKELFELRVVEHQTWFGVEKLEVYGLKPTSGLCFSCPFFERK
jgi:hypothetical protein